MENKNILMLRHHPMNVHFTNAWYTNQTEEDLSDYVIVDVTSRVVYNKAFMEAHPTFAKDFSPFYIGPVTSSDGVKANIFEIFWQCGKVYPCHDNNGTPAEDFFTWRNNFYAKEQCTKDLMRHACHDLGYEHNDTRYFAYYDKEAGKYIPLNYVDSRKKVYVPEYAKLVYNTESFKYLKSILDEGKKLALVDFDAYNYNETCAMEKRYVSYLGECKKNQWEPVAKTEFMKVDSMKKALDCSFLKAGHGFIIKALLQGDLVVENGVVIDKGGIL